jgi:hypothetical protein
MAITFSDLSKFAPIPNNAKSKNIKKPNNTNISASIKPASVPPKPPKMENTSTNSSSGGNKEKIALNSGNDVYVWKIPLIVINKFVIDRYNISQLSIFNDEFLPRIKMKLAYKNSYFLHLYHRKKMSQTLIQN